jgi:autotransporter-associated beta strand protein
MKNIFQKSNSINSGANTRLDFIAMKNFYASQCKTPHNHSMKNRLFTAVFLTLFLVVSSVSSGANLTWNTTDGTWTNNASWSPSQQPGSGDGVIFNGSSSDYTSTLGANYTIFRLTANGTSGAGNLTIAPGGNYILTLSASDGGGSPSAIQINAGAGAVLIQSALKLDPNDGDDNIISVENAAGLTLTQFATGTDGFIKEGNGTLFLNLSGNNTIARYVAIEQGTVALLGGSITQNSSMGIADSAGSNGTLNIGAGDMDVVGGFYIREEGAGTVNVNGGNLTLANQVDIGTGNGTAIINLNIGKLQQTAGWTGMTIGGGNGSGEINIHGGEFSVAGAFSIGNNGTLNISGGNTTIQDITNVNQGIGADGANAVINLTGGTLAAGGIDLSNDAVFNYGNGTSAGNLQVLQIGTPQDSNGTWNINHNGTATIGLDVFNNVAINHIGSGTTNLTGNFSNAVPMTISSGTLVFGGSGGYLPYGGIVNNSSLVFARSVDNNLTSNISGTGSLTQNGTAITFLFGNNTYTGNTIIESGGLSFGTTTSLYNGTVADWSSNKIVVESGATFLMGMGKNGSFTSNEVTSVLSGLSTNRTNSAGGFLAGSNVGFDVTGPNGYISVDLSTPITDSTGVGGGSLGLVKVGVGKLVLSSNSTYTGETRIEQGILELGAGVSIPSTGNLTINGGGIFNLNSTNQTLSNVTLNNGTINRGSFVDLTVTNSLVLQSGTISAPVDGTGSVLKTGAGSVLVHYGLDLTGGTTIESGTLQIGAGSTEGSISGNIAILQNGTLSVNRSDSHGIAGVLSGNGAFNKQGNSTLTLTGSSAGFGGTTTIAAGTLQIGDGGSLGGNISATTGTTLAYNSIGEAFLDGLSGNGTLVQAGNGTLIVASDLPGFTGSTQIQSGTLQLGNGGSTGLISANITNNGTLALNRSDDFTFSTNSSGTGVLLKLGSNTVTLNRTQSNTGGTVVDSGTFVLSSDNLLATSGNLAVNNAGTLSLGSNNQTLSTLTLNGGNITGTGTLTANTGFNIQSGSISALLAGTGGVVKSSVGNFSITGNNTYSGKTIVEDGTVSFDNASATGTNTQALGTNASVDLGVALSTSGTLNYTGAAGTFAKNIKALGSGNNTVMNTGSGLLTLTGTLTKNGTILVLAGGAGGIQVNGVIAGSAENSDLILNGGNITLNATNTYNGPTFLNNGAFLSLAVANALPGDLIIDATSSVAFGANQTIEALSGVAGSTIDIGSYTLTMGSNATDSLYEGGIEGSGKVVKTGTNAITLSGTNTYNGTTTINGGVLVFGTPASLYNGDNSTWTGDNIIVNSGGAFALSVGANGSFSEEQALSIFQTLTSNATAGGILDGGSVGLDVTGEMSLTEVTADREGGGAVGFVKLGDGSLTLTGNNTYTGATDIRGGTLSLASSDLLVATGNLTVQGGTLALGSNNQTFNRVTLAEGSITGNGGTLTASGYAVQSGTATANLAGNATLAKTGAGTAILSGNNTYTGSTTISAGALTFLTSTSLYGGDSARWTSGNITAATGSTMALGVGGTDAFSSSNIDTLVTNLTQSQTTSGGIAAGARIGLDTSGGDASLSTIFKDRTGTGSGTLSLVKLGSGTLSLTGNNSYTGGTFIETGTLSGNSLGLKGNITNNGTLLLGTYGTYQTEVSGNGNLLVGNSANMILAGNATMTGGTTIQSGTLTIGGVIDPTNPYSPSSYRAGSLSGNVANEGSLVFDLSLYAGTRTYNGIISGNGRLSTTFTYPHYPSGANGTLVLTGNNTFTGGTSVSIGTVDISGGTLASTGSVTVSNIGTFAIGSSNQIIGNFTIGYGSVTGSGSLTAQSYDLQHGSIAPGLAGTAGLEKNAYGYSSQSISYDNGRVYLTGNNTSSGNITINSGILSFDNVQSLYSGNNASWTKEKISVSANATLSLGTGIGTATSGFNNAQITEIFSNLTQNGTGGLAANAKIGLNTISDFTLTTTITDRPDGGVLGLDKIGDGNLILDANNTFTGELSIFEGTVTLGRNNALRTSSDLVVDSKSSASYGFNVGNYSQQFVDITLKEGLLAGGSGAFIATGNYTMVKGNATANLSGNASLIKTNTSGSSYYVSEPEIVFLSGNNSYTGRTTVDGLAWSGTQSPSPSSNSGAPTKDNAKLQFQTVGSLYGGNATLWTPENISVDSYGIFSLRTGSAGFDGTQVSTLIQNLITANRSTGGFLDKSVLGIDTNGEDLVINDDIGDTTGLTSGGGAVGLVKYGSGTLTLNGNSTRSFSTSVTGGNLVLGANATLSSASANLLVDNALLNMDATNQTVRKVTVTSGSILGSGTLTSSADGFVFGSANITANLAGAVGATIDQGTTILSGNNTYTGNTTMGYSATLSLANVNALSGSTLVVLSNYSGPLQLSVGGTNTYNFGGLSGTGNITTGSNSLTIGANSQNSTYSGNLSGTGSITKTGNGTLTLTGNNTYTGGTTISSGTLSISSNGSISHASVDTNIGNGTLNLASGSISNARGNIGVNADNTGVANVSGGNWTNSNYFTVGDSGDGTLNLSGGLISNTGNYSYIGASSGSSGVANVSGGNWTNANEFRVGSSGNGTLNITGGTVTNVVGFVATFNGTTGVVNVSGGTWSNSDRLRLGRYGNGTLNLTGGNVSIAGGAGNLTVAVNTSSTGILNIGNGSTVGNLQAARVTAGNGTAIVNFNHSGTHAFSPIMEGNLAVNKLGAGTTTLSGNNTYTGGTFITSGTLEGNTQSLQGAITNNASVVFNQTTNGTYSGVLSGSGEFAKTGAGTLTVSGNSSSFNGTAAINSGTVSLTGSMAGATTAINSGGTLTGNGSLGAVTINSGGTIAPGNSAGIITTGNMTWNSGGTYAWELGNANSTAGTGWDLMSSTGSLTIGANSTNKFTIAASTTNGSGFDPNVKNASWKIAEFAGGISGFSADAFNITTTGFENLPAIYGFGVSSNGTALNFSYATVATWIGGTGNWTNTANWETGFAAINGVTVDYAGTNGTSTNDSTVGNINALVFTNNATGSFTLTGGNLTIGEGGITNNSNSTQTIALNLRLGADQTFAANTANLVVSGNISGGISHQTYEGFTLTKEGNQTLTLSGANTYSGSTTVNAGTLLVEGAVRDVTNNATFTVQSSGVAGSVDNLAGATGTNNGTVASLANAGTFTNGGNITADATTSGTLTSTGRIGGTFGVDGGLATIGAGGQVAGTSTITSGTLDVSGTVAGVTNNATLTIQQSGVAGSVTNLAGATGTNNGTAASLANAGTFTNSGNITGNATTSGTLSSTGRIGGTLGVDGGLATIGAGGQVAGTSTITSGTLDVSGTVAGVTNNASLTIQQSGIAESVTNLAGATGTNNGTAASLANAGTFTNSGNITGNATTSEMLSSTGRISGTLGVESGSATIGAGGQVEGSSTITSGTLDVSGTVAGVTNNATLTIQQGGIAGSVSNLAPATGTNNGTAASLANAGTFTNSGNITGNATTSGTLSSTGTIGGTLGVDGGLATIGAGGQVAGTSTITSGTLDVSGTVAGVSNNATLTIQQGGIAGSVTNLVGATVTNNGTAASLANAGTFTNRGNITGDLLSFDGAVTVAQSGQVSGNTTIGDGEFVVAGSVAAVTSNALLRVEQSGVAGNVVNLGNGTATNNGTVALLLNSGSFTNSGNITGEVISFGTLFNSGNIGGALTVGGGETTISGTVAGPTAISAGVLQGTGTLGSVSLNSGGTIAPGTGNGTATLTVGNSLWNGGGIYNWQTSSLNGTAGSDWDLITSGGMLTLNATSANPISFTLSTLGIATLADVKKASWEVGSFEGGISGFEKKAFAFDPAGMAGNDGRYFMSLGANNTALVLNYKSAATWITGSGNWTIATQWEDEAFPENGDEVEFAGPGGTSTNNFAAASLSSISGFNFVEGAGAYTVNGNTLQIGEDGIINASSNLQTIGMDLTAGDVLKVDAAAADIEISGIISGNSALTKNGSSTLSLSGNNTYSGLTTISAGTLALGGTAGAISSNISVDSGATFAVNRTNEAIISNVISGAGSFAQVGSGVTRLRATNTYTGGTTISEGKLWVEAPQALGTGSVTLDGGKLLVTSSQESIMGNLTLSIGGNLDWTGGRIAFFDTGSSPLAQDLKINVAGNFTVSTLGNATFDFSEVQALDSGAYTLVSTNGTVTADNGKFTAAHGEYTKLFGSFTTTNKTVVYTVTGAESTGPNIENNGGPNTPVVADYDVTQATITKGQTNIVNALKFGNNAPLAIETGGKLIVTSGVLNVQSGASVVSGGTVVTPGNFDKLGTGELDVQSNMSVNGTALVNAGLLSVNGQLAANEVVVDPLASLGGAGLIITQNVVVLGNLSPGNSPGTLSIAGNLLLSDGSSTVIEIASPTNFDRIVVSGQATLGGTLEAQSYEGAKITPGTRYDFLQAGSIVGEFDSIVVPDGLRGRFLNLGTVGSLLFGPESFVPYALNPNQRNVAKALDSFVLATEGDAVLVGTALDSLTTEQFPAAFDQIMPGFYESLGDILIEQTYNQTQLLTQRLGTLRLGATGFQSIGLSQPIKYDKDGKSTADAKTASPIVESAIETNWNAWVMANGEFSISRGLAGVPNYNNNAGGFLVGADYRLSENFVAGLFAGYEYSYAKYNGGSSTRGNSALFGLYGSYTHEDGYYADAIVSGGYTGFQTRRSIEFGSIDRTARANPNSGQFSAALNLGKDFEVGKFTLGPIIGAQYTYAGIGGFTETGADSLDLALGEQNANSLRTNLGARLAYNWEVATNTTLIPEVRGFWMHEFLNEPRNISSALEGGSGPSFDYETSAPYSNSVFGGAGISAKVGDRWSASVFYNVNFGAEGYTNNIISTSLGFSF